MLPPEPASPKPSANRKCDFGVTPRMVSPSDVMVIDPPPAVPPLTSTAFSRSIFPDGGTPIAVSEIVPPSWALAVVVVALSPLLDPPRSEMLPDATTEVPERRPAVIRIDPAVAAAVLAFEIDTSPSAFTVSEPAPAPLTSTGVAAAFVWTTNPPVPSVSVTMPPGPEVPPVAVSLPLLPTVSLCARISNVLDPPTNPPLCSVTSRVPKSNVQLAPGLGGVTVTVRLIVQALAVQDAVQLPPQPDITSAAVQTAAACRAGATSRTSAAATSARLTGTLPSCRCGTE